MGHLRRKKGSPFWFAVWRAGRQVVNRSTKETNKHKAQTKAARWWAEAEKSFHKKIGKITFKELADRWFESQKPNLKIQTTNSYQEVLNRVLPYFKDRIVRDIRPEHIERFKTEEVNKKLSSRSVNYDLWILRAILGYAVTLGYSHTNAAKLVRGMKRRSMDHKPFSLEDFHNLLKVMDGQDKVLVQLAGLVGLRRGEILGLKWSNINFETNKAEIRETYNGPKFGIDTPKSGESRTVLLVPEVVQSLKSHRIQQEQLRRWYKKGKWANPDLVFTTADGDYLIPWHVGDRILDPALKRAKLSHIRFHDLRGIAITFMLEAGWPLKLVMQQVGHKTPAMTLSVYARVTKESEQQAVEKLQKHVFG